MSLWNLILLVIGGMFALQLFALLVLMVHARLSKPNTQATAFPTCEIPEILVHHTQVQVYTEGTHLFADMLAAIESAEKTIFIESYIWKADELGRRFKDLLARKAEEGVAVYVIYDSFANLVVPRRFFSFPNTMHVLRFRAWRKPWHALDLRRWGRDHRKILVVDNRIGFVGGYNIGELYRTSWRDTHMRLEGTEVDDLVFSFTDFWNANRSRNLPRLPTPIRSWSAELRAYRNDPHQLIFPIRSIYIEAIEQAQHHIYITSAYFIPDEAILRALERAARRGVDVRVLVPWDSNHVLADWLARHNFSRCLRQGVRIFAYQNSMIHAKSATIDGIWSTIGTANIDRLSLLGNFEINIEIFNTDLARVMDEIFECDLTNAFEIMPEKWARRPWLARAGELILAPLWPLL
ncbi:MAG: phosphatidylserine/phosphatidylglycerophosphate/cardiolipin synthase family protein [Oscillochloris sp.]|nr:phosphatidylserine/phosphatidylglycerophosphate/cardiolipin synthase family protein [Oscillochloris sp.]